MKMRSDTATNRWNVPDWRKSTLYPKPDEVSDTQWRWEFLRRSDEYRRDWEIYQEDPHPYKIAIEGDPDDSTLYLPYYPQEHEDRWEDIWRFLRKYGLARLLDPSVPTPRYLTFHFVPFAADPKDNPEFRQAGVDIRSIPWQLQNPYLAWFDLSKPLHDQILHYVKAVQREKAIALDKLTYTSKSKGGKRESYLESERAMILAAIEGVEVKESNARPPSKRNKKSKREHWPTLLRLLDARDLKQKPSWATIGDLLYHDNKDPSSHARVTHNKTAQSLWWKIEIERNPGPNVWMDNVSWQDVDSVLPPLEANKPLLLDWLDKLPPRLSSIMFSALT